MTNNTKIIIVATITIVVGFVVLIIIFPLRERVINTQKTQTSTSPSASATQTAGGKYPTSTETPNTEFMNEDLGENKADNLIANTPFYTEHFSVDYDNKTNTFTIGLYAILNHAWQLEQYKKDLAQYKREALSWIALQGVNIYDLKIEYNPPDAKDM